MQRISQIGILLVVIILPVILLTLFFSGERNIFPFKPEGLGKETVHIGSATITVSVADTAEERTQGLSGQASLPTNSGLLFVFPKAGAHGIWMKDMNFPLDIIWISDNLQIVDVRKNISPDSYPQTFYPRLNARFILEVNSLFTEIWGIKVGDEVVLPKRFRP